MLEPNDSRARVYDLICIAMLVATCLLIRVPALDRVALNPDESQYEATAAYLLAAGESAFLLPYTTAANLALYKGMAWLFGPYSMTEMRILVLLIALAGAVMLYRVVSVEGSRLGGLMAGLVFIHYSIPFEGFTANREWFSGIGLLTGMLLFGQALRREGRRRGGLIFLAGVACCIALWFKIQAAFMTLAIPVVLFWIGWTQRRVRRSLVEISFYATGGVLAYAFYCLQFFLAGTLRQFLVFLLPAVTDYVLQNEATVQAGSSVGPPLYLQHFLVGLPFKPLLIVAYGLSALCLGFAARRIFRRYEKARGIVERPVVLLYVLYFLTSLISISLGNRFFAHYYLFMIPPLAALVGFAVAQLRQRRFNPAWLQIASYVLIGLLLLGQIMMLGGSIPSLLARWPATAPLLIHVAAFLTLAAFALSSRRRLLGGAAALIGLQVALLVFSTQRQQPPPSLPHHGRSLDVLAEQIRSRSSSKDRLFVWGWLPEIYSMTRMEPSSVLTITQYVVNDDVASPTEPRLNRPMAELLMSDLKRRPPELIVNAWRRSWTMVKPSNPWLYRLELYPEFELGEYIKTHYRYIGQYNGCDLYGRRDPAENP